MTEHDQTDTPSDAAPLDTIVIGGGISGLTTAWGLARAGKRIALIEAAPRAGGVIGTLREDGWQTETGPNTLMVKAPLYALLADLGLTEQAILADQRAARRYVVSQGQMVALPSGPVSALTSPLMRPVWPWLLREPWIAPAKGEETVAGFVSRRLGPAMLRSFVDPFVSGIFGGDPARLSVQAAFPRLAAFESGHGSILRGALAKVATKPAPSPFARPPKGWRSVIASFPNGLQTLPERLADRLAERAEVMLDTPVSRIARVGDLWQVEAKGQIREAHRLVLAVPAKAAAKLLEPLDTEIAALLNQIVYAPMASLALGFAPGTVAHPLDAFGVLLPRPEGRRTLGALFPSTLFAGRAPEGGKLISAFIGGRLDPGAVALSDDELSEIAMRELGDLLGLSAPPVWRHVRRWPEAIPQYEIGHLDRIAAIAAREERMPGLTLTGNWRDGISMTDRVTNGLTLAAQLAERR